MASGTIDVDLYANRFYSSNIFDIDTLVDIVEKTPDGSISFLGIGGNFNITLGGSTSGYSGLGLFKHFANSSIEYTVFGEKIGQGTIALPSKTVTKWRTI